MLLRAPKVAPTDGVSARVVDLQKVMDLRQRLDAAAAVADQKAAPTAVAAPTAAAATAAPSAAAVADDAPKPLSAEAMSVIKRVRCMYREMVPAVDILSHLSSALSAVGVDYRAWEVQGAVYDVVLKDKCVERYGPSPTYCDAFAKLYLHHIEKQKQADVHDALYEESARLFKAAVAYAKHRDAYRGVVPRMCAKTFQMSDADDDTLSMFFNEGMNHSLGLSAWPGGLFTAEFVLHHRKLFGGRRCLELGAGVGFSSMAMAYAGASHVVTTDFETEVLQLLTNNMRTNGFTVSSSTDAEPAPAPAATDKAPEPDTADGDVADTKSAASVAAASLPARALSGAEYARAYPQRSAHPALIRVDKLDWFEYDESVLLRWAPDITVASDTIYAPELIPPQIRIFQLLLKAKTRSVTSHLTHALAHAPAATTATATATAAGAAAPAPAAAAPAAPAAASAASAAAAGAGGAKVRFVPPPTPVVDLTPSLYGSEQLPCVFLILCVRNEDTFAYLLRCLYESGLAYAEVTLDAVPRRFTYGRHALKCFRIARATDAAAAARDAADAAAVAAAAPAAAAAALPPTDEAEAVAAAAASAAK